MVVPSTLKSPATCKSPAAYVLPVACCTVKLPTPMFNSVPSNVKLASSSTAPPVPANTIRLSVKSSIIALASVDSLSTLIVPVICVLPFATSTSKTSLPLGPIKKFVPSKRKLASSSSSPLLPAITILLLVKSSTFTLASVD